MPSPRCAMCRAKITLTESIIKCRCRSAFCDKHRTAEAHGCQYNYRAQTEQKLRSDFSLGAREGDTAGEFARGYAGDHCDRITCLGHSAALVALAAGLIWCTARCIVQRGGGDDDDAPLWPLLPALALSVVLAKLSFLLARRDVRSCRFCIWSVEAARFPRRALAHEWLTMKENLKFLLTQGQSNCLTSELYSRDDMSVQDIVRIVRRKIDRGRE